VVSHGSIFIDSDMARFKFGYTMEHAMRRHDGPKVKVWERPAGSKCRGISAFAAKMAFNFAGKIQMSAVFANMQRAYAYRPAKVIVVVQPNPRSPRPIVRSCAQRLPRPRHDRHEYNLGVTLGAETMTERDQFFAQFQVIEYLAVEYDPGCIVLIAMGC